jgi:hypothetical protein
MNKLNYEIQKMDYFSKLSKMNDEELLNETNEAILLQICSFVDESYYAGAWKNELCLDECQKRGKLEIYKNAEKQVKERRWICYG